MDIAKVLVELRRELADLDAAILTLERLQVKSTRRGRPPKLLTELRRARKSAAERVVEPRRATKGPAQT
jgi:hypothetical protein